jgi:hypothetical protein
VGQRKTVQDDQEGRGVRRGGGGRRCRAHIVKKISVNIRHY